jgi:hypothetical protein
MNARRLRAAKNSCGFPNFSLGGINEINALKFRVANFSLAVSWNINGLCDKKFGNRHSRFSFAP